MAEASREATGAAPPPLHVVVFPWLAFGHFVPFLELSEQLARRGHAVTFVSTPRNVARLRPVSPRIRLLPLPLPSVDGLPDGAESTADVPPEKVDLLKVAFDGLAAPFAGFLDEACAGGDGATEFGRRPDWIFVDFAHYWLPPIAEQHKVPCALFHICPAPFMAFIGPKAANDAHPRTTAEDLMAQPRWIPFPTTIAHRLHEARDMLVQTFRANASGPSDAGRLWQTEQRCPPVILRGSREVDGPLGPFLADLFGKPVALCGLLAPYDAALAAQEGADHVDDESESASLMRWLDEQPARSVIYVAFGSEAPLTGHHVRELALGLELAGARFLWALRGPSAALLPDGFEERVAVSGRGVVRVGWVPQVRILAHGAVGAFLTHAGLSSLAESFLFGHPLVMLPLFLDQGVTARGMAARGVGLEVPRGEGDGSFGRDDVAATVRRVMAEGEEGRAFARNAGELQAVLWDRAKQDEYVDELVEHLQRR
ncbi:putative UDP-rhamnose:rhamnosyltransferase 1 [Triticum urartu]|nr:putative UDP-rhamnose:rhamnosyltransferase 1 [Triticum urartu]XP_048547354.1 putative UDP-rhamnose:rhamnosyltransferase 1 [Triticum urartu]